MKRSRIFAIPLILLAYCSCDSGNIIEKERTFDQTGLTVKLTGSVSGIDQWPEEYDVVLAAFNDESPYSLIQKHVEADAMPLTMSNIPPEASTIELCIVDRLRERVATIKKMDITDAMIRHAKDTLQMEVGTIEAGMFSTIKRVVFVEKGECTRCHGEPVRAAGKLSLLPDHAYTALVGQASTTDPTQVRVVPNDADASWLIRVLTPGNEHLTRYADHPNILNNEYDQKFLKLLRDWVNAGAKE